MGGYSDRAELGGRMNMGVEKGVGASDSLKLSGGPKMTCYDADGELKWQLETPNLVTDQGENHALGVILASATQITSWAVGLLANSAGAPAETWTIGNITNTAGTPTDEFTGYSETVRQAYSVPTGTPTGQSIDNTATPASFSITSTGTVKGAFTVSTNTKGGDSGILYNVATSSRTVSSGDTVKVEYTNNAGGA